MDTLNDRIMPAPLAELERPIVFFHVNIPIVFEDIAQLVHIHIVRDCKVQNYQGSFTDVHFLIHGSLSVHPQFAVLPMSWGIST